MLRASIFAIALSASPAHAGVLIAPWQLLESHFFQWGDWTEVFEFGPCSDQIPYRMNNPPPFVEPVPIFWNPQPIDLPPHWIDTPPPGWTPTAVPEPSTWVMIIIGAFGMGKIYWRKRRPATLSRAEWRSMPMN